jgi:hypothetical protein
LLICGGPNAIRTSAGLGTLLPVKVNGTRMTADIGSLGDFAGAPFIVNMPAVVAQVEPTTGRMIAGNKDLPLLIHRKLDRGHISYLVLDPNLEPMRTWIGNDSLWPKVLSFTPPTQGAGTQLSQREISRALSNIPSLDVPSVLLVVAFLFLYIAIVGPLNFLILKLVDKRALAWITVPALILLFGCMAYVSGFVMRGREVIVSEVSIVRALPESGMLKVDSFVGLYSPTRRPYDVRLADDVLVHRLENSSYAPSSNAREPLTVEQGPPTYLRRLEVDIGAMRDFVMYSIRPGPAIEAHLTLDHTPGNRYHVEGTIANHGSLDLEHCALVWNYEPIEIPDLPAGATTQVAVDFQSSSTIPPYQFADELLGRSSVGGKERRERERKRAILNSLFYSSSRSGYVQSQGLMSGLSLLGWANTSPLQIDVEKTPSTANVTVLLIAPLPTSSIAAGEITIPKGTMTWQHTGTGQTMSPYDLYRGNTKVTYRFQLPPHARDIVVEKLFLHADGIGPLPYGDPPVIYIRDAAGDKWETFNKLHWGQNELPDPQRFIQDDTIGVMVVTSTIDNPLAIDFSAIGKRP